MNLDDSFDLNDRSAYSTRVDRSDFNYLLAQYKRAVYTKCISVVLIEPWQSSESIDLMAAIYGGTDATE